ncbi:MAG: peptidoglycan editing factor PgeF [Alphaproteobacteria bacterium]|nr:peptidoglycan editing factor PgeF [Alphaproteobacteria bacterium]
MITCPALSTIPHLRHGFFGRVGGVSGGLYASLNCGYGSGDDMAHVTENRRRVCDILGGGMRLITCHQVHSSEVITVNAPWEASDAPQADAMVTDKPGIVLGVLTADCLPVLFSDSKKYIIGAAHAGWKGAIGGVLEAVLQAMRELGAEDIIATIGPAIAQDSYEVGDEFYERFLQESAENARYFRAFKEDKYFFDLPGYAKNRLERAGVAQINGLAYDTCLLENAFFSYRRATQRGESVYGRQVAAIVME